MPVEIRELIIKANIVDEEGAFGSKKTERSPEEWARLKKEIIEECKHQVLDELNKKGER